MDRPPTEVLVAIALELLEKYDNAESMLIDVIGDDGVTTVAQAHRKRIAEVEQYRSAIRTATGG